jgi:hypothetical protein
MVVLVALLGVQHAPIARADTITVCEDGSCQFTSIQAAVYAASDGDTISILDAEHTESQIFVNEDVTIVGGHLSGTIVQAVPEGRVAASRVFMIGSAARVTLRGVTIRYGRAAGRPARGGGILNYGVLTLEGVTVTANQALGSDGAPGGKAEGGGIYNAGVLIIANSTVSDNRAVGGEGSAGHDGGDGRGGGIANGSSRVLTVTHSTVSGNAVGGGAGYG